MKDPHYYTGDDDREFGPEPDEDEDEDRCTYCDAKPTEAHHPACRFYVPVCACGRIARRHVNGVPTCTQCAPAGELIGMRW